MLQTARTLWGQRFNGTANVSGSMGSVGNISLISNYDYDCGSLGAQWNNVYSRAYHIGQSRGTNYISEGNGDNATYNAFNMKIHAHWGIGIVDTTDTCRIVINSRTGSLSMRGVLNPEGGIAVPYTSGTWLSMATRTNLMYGSIAQSSGGAHSLFRVTAYNGSVLAFGGLGNYVGFYGYSQANIDNNTNESSFRAIWDMTNGNFTFSDSVSAGGSLSAGTFVQVGSARLYYDSTNNALYVQKSDGTACGFYATGFMSAKGSNSSSGSAVAGVTELSGLDDVLLSSPGNGQSLVYRNGYWRNETVSGGGGSASVAWDDITGKPTWIPTSDGSGSGIDADLLDGTHKSGLFTAMTYSGSTLSITIGGTRRTATINASGGGASSVSVSSSSSRNISVTVDGHTDYVNDLYATYSTYADQLRTARTIWGQSFNGSGSVSGNMTGVGIIYFSNNVNIRAINSSTAGIYASNNAGGLMVKSLYIGTSYSGSAGDGLLVVNNNGNAVTIGSQNSTFCHIYNSKSIPFIFNYTVATTAGDLGTSTYRWGTVYAKNALNTSSDLRLKSVLGDIPLTVDAVAAAPSFLYRWKSGKDAATHAGSAAQYWQKALPQAVLKGEDGYLSMEYDRLALAAVITTARTVVDHEQRIRRLEDALKVAV